MRRTGLAIVSCIAIAAALAAADHPDHKIVPPEKIEWKDGPASLPAGARFAVLEGDPTQEGFFTLRIKVPAGYRIPPHTHPRVERVTVLEGTVRLGMGREWNDEAMETLPTGSFFYMHPGMVHFVVTDDDTVIQLNAVGPWEIHYINPSDDPRLAQR